MIHILSIILRLYFLIGLGLTLRHLIRTTKDDIGVIYVIVSILIAPVTFATYHVGRFWRKLRR